MIKAVLFDLDGTLVNSLNDLADATNFALEYLGFPTHEVEKFKYFVGDGIPKLIERVLPAEKCDEEHKNKCLELFFQYYSVHFADKTKVYTDVPELVNQLKKQGIAMAVVSNKAQEMTNLVVNKLYGDTFDLVLGKREGVPAKPDPAMLKLAASEIKIRPENCAFIGDSGMDMAAAVGAGMLPIGVLWGFRTEEELKSNGAEYILNNPKDIFRIIGEV